MNLLVVLLLMLLVLVSAACWLVSAACLDAGTRRMQGIMSNTSLAGNPSICVLLLQMECDWLCVMILL